MRILIVDDDFVSRAKLEALMSEYGDCDVAEDGHQALDMFEQAHDQSANYDLITMDIDMPGMSGHEVLSKIREWEEAHEVYKQGHCAKIMMSTSMQSRTDIMSSFRNGCEGYLKKPVTPEKLAEALAAIDIHGREQVTDASMGA
jgi:two-component system, chemotaxis family, chemotaxis protein CheY